MRTTRYAQALREPHGWRVISVIAAALSMAFATTGCVYDVDGTAAATDLAGAPRGNSAQVVEASDLAATEDVAAPLARQAILRGHAAGEDGDRLATNSDPRAGSTRAVEPPTSPWEELPIEPMAWSGADDDEGDEQGEDGGGSEPDPQPWVTSSARGGGKTGHDGL